MSSMSVATSWSCPSLYRLEEGFSGTKKLVTGGKRRSTTSGMMKTTQGCRYHLRVESQGGSREAQSQPVRFVDEDITTGVAVDTRGALHTEGAHQTPRNCWSDHVDQRFDVEQAIGVYMTLDD